MILQGRPWDAIQYYRRAVEANPHLPEATSGLVNSMHALCDWRGRGKIPSETIAIDDDGNIFEDAGSESISGWMPKVIEICDRQLAGVFSQNVGVLQMTRTLDEWLALVEFIVGRTLLAQERSRWTARLAPFYTDFHRSDRCINEGGYAVRFVEWAQRRLQRRWYLETYGRVSHSDHFLERPVPSVDTKLPYQRPALYPLMVPPPTPSVLPFHTVCSIYNISGSILTLS